MAKKQFKAESKRLLDLMINSIYTNKEIFLRELISNASDAIDKLYYKSLTENIGGLDRSDFLIRLTPDKEENTLTIEDNGIGMSKEELEENLGIIAKSGSGEFKAGGENKEDIDIIGQFGVGFYSAFMVADKISVLSRAYGSDEAYLWESSGADGYTVTSSAKDTIGTVITLKLKADTEDEKYSSYLSEYKLRELIRHYSDYIRYPIIMNCEKSKYIEPTEEEKNKEDYEPKYETYREDETLNSMVPIWKKPKSELTDEDYNNFYSDKFFDYNAPLKVIHANIEGALNYNALMFIPGKAPYNFYTREYEKGLQLYSSGVLIMEKCPELIGDYFSFVRGVVDSADLSLNISREMLQHDRQLKAIAVRLEKRIKTELKDMLTTDREKYEAFFDAFGLQLKYGAYSGYGANKELLEDLLMFKSSFEDKYVTFEEYISRMKPDQQYIYYACGKTIDVISRLPQCEMLRDKGYEILYLTDDVDEFALKTLHASGEKEFKNAGEGDLKLPQSEEEKKRLEEASEENKELLELLCSDLEGKVAKVVLSERLKSHAVCFSSGEGLSIEMEKVLNQMPSTEKVKADKVLEINPDHKVFTSLKARYSLDKNDEQIKKYARLLYDQACLIEGLPLQDASEFSSLICELMV